MTLMWQEINEQPEGLLRCLHRNTEVIEKLNEEIKKSDNRTIMIAARGTSDHAAVYGKYIFEILTGLPVELTVPSVFTMYHKSLRLENTLVIGISQSGKASDVLEVLKAANELKAITVSITNFSDSPMALGRLSS